LLVQVRIALPLYSITSIAACCYVASNRDSVLLDNPALTRDVGGITVVASLRHRAAHFARGCCSEVCFFIVMPAVASICWTVFILLLAQRRRFASVACHCFIATTKPLWYFLMV